MPLEHESVNHSAKEYVCDQAHTNGIELFWSMLKREHYGTYHKMSPKHLNRYIRQFAGRHNIRGLNSVDQMGSVVSGMNGQRLTYEGLTEPNGLSSCARPATC